MGRRRRAIFASLALVAALVATVGTAGVSSVAADRAVQVAVADDENAFLGIDPLPDGDAAGDRGDDPEAAMRPATYHGDATVMVHANETTLRLLTVTNRFDHGISVTVDLAEERPETRMNEYVSAEDAGLPEPIGAVDRRPGRLAPGDSAGLDAEIDCRDGTGGTIELRVSADGDGVRVAATRTIEIYCS